jgi:hypothetical protein
LKPKSKLKISRPIKPLLPNSTRSKESLTKKPPRKLLSTQLNLLRMSKPLNKKMKSMPSPRRLKMQKLLKGPPKKLRKQLKKNLRKMKSKKKKLRRNNSPSTKRRKFIIKPHQLRPPIKFLKRKRHLQ